MIPIKRIVVEGPDCSGKTSLVESLKKATQYKYNIQDRSTLSMLVYGIFNSRDNVRQYKRDFEEEIADQNNVVILVLPSKEDLISRFEKRGDEIQNIQSILELRDIFEEISKIHIERRNFIIVKNGKNDTDYIKEELSILSAQTPNNFKLFNCVSKLEGSECAKVSFVFNRNEANYHGSLLSKSFKDEKEGDYFLQIATKLNEKIRYEKMGWNDAGIIQTDQSRRFIFTDQNCISLIHVTYEQNVLSAKCVCRSTNATSNDVDIEFLCRLICSYCTQFENVTSVVVNVEMNRLHRNPAL